MGKRKKWLYAVIALLLTGIILTDNEAVLKHIYIAERPVTRVALVPLDSRPVNTFFSEMSAKAGGLELMMPDHALLGRFTDPGDGQAIGQWLEQHAAKADGTVVSASMLAYGGLVASRTSAQPFEKALANLQALKKLKEKAPTKPLYVFDTIQRLSITATNDETRKYYSQIREWAILADEVQNLGMVERKARLAELEASIPKSLLQEYIAARARNFQINSLLIDWVREGHIDYLALAQDDAAVHGLHRSERNQLVAKAESLGVSDRVNIFPGDDEVGTVLVTRLALAKMGIHPAVAVRYSGIHGDKWIPPFEDTDFDSNVRKHIAALGGTVTDDFERADLIFMINTPSAAESLDHRRSELDSFTAEMAAHISTGKKVAVADVAITNHADPELIRRLKEAVDLTQLFSYTAWGTAGNNMGSALGQALARVSFLEHESTVKKTVLVASAKAHVSLLVASFAGDHDYRNEVQAQARMLLHKLGGTNEYDLGQYYPDVNAFVAEEISRRVRSWYLDEFHGRSIKLGQHQNKMLNGTIAELRSIQVALPWPRLFEVKIIPEVHIEEYRSQ